LASIVKGPPLGKAAPVAPEGVPQALPGWPLLLAVAALAGALRWWTRARLIYNWDSVQYALAIQRYDLHLHQPHPPGSYFYVLAARGLTVVTGDAHTSLLAVSAAASALTVLGLYGLGREVGDRRTAAWAALLGTTAPLFWFYGSVGLNYAADGLLATLVGLASLRLLKGRDDWATALLAGASFGLAGGFRPTSLLFLAPIWGLGVGRLALRRPGAALLAFATAALLTVAWMAPSAAGAGGPAAYARLNRTMDHLLGQTAIWLVPDPWATLRYAGTTHRRCLESMLGVGWLLIIPALLAARRSGRGGPRLGPGAGSPGHWTLAAFWVLWILPAALFYLLVHFNSPGYTLVYAGAVVAMAARALAWWTAAWSRPALLAALAAVGLANGALFWFGFPWATPQWGQRAISRAEIADHDAYWRALRRYLAERYPPDTVQLLVSGTSTEGLRVAEGLLPTYDAGIGQVVDLRPGQLPAAIRSLPFLHFRSAASVLQDPRPALAVWRTDEDRRYHRNTFRGLLPGIPTARIDGGRRVGVIPTGAPSPGR
jgi:hypothetical protein